VVSVLFAVEGKHRLVGPSTSDGVPTFPAVEDAVRALANMSWYARWRRTTSGEFVDPAEVDVDRARALVTEWLRESPAGFDLAGETLSHLLGCYGIRLWPRRTAHSVDEAVAAAAELGYPVVLKTADSHLRLRSDLGGIYFDIANEVELQHQFGARLSELTTMHYDRLVVQRQAQPGAAVVLQTCEDPLFGPVLSFGFAGVAYDILDDRAYAIPPLTDVDVDQLVCGPRAAALLDAGDGSDALDLAPLRDIVARVSRLADDLPEVSTLTLRPIVVSRDGAAVLGAFARLGEPASRTDLPARRLLG
jgi:acyl-CoA synthetase (NDP forming)